MRYSPAEVASAAGVSVDVLAYWARVGLLAPSMSGGRYDSRGMSMAIVLGEAHRLAAPGPILTSLVEALDSDPHAWPDRILIDTAGNVQTSGEIVDDPLAGWALRPRRILARSGPQIMLALSAA